MTTHTWIRFTSPELGVRRGVKTLHLSNAAAAELVERLDAQSTWTRDGELRELGDFCHWCPEAACAVHYVRAHPSTAVGRQSRDLLIGPELIRRFDLEPHIVVHLAVDRGKPFREGRRMYPFDWNGTGTTACGTYVVNTHCADDFDDVTCKACRAQAESLAAVGAALADGCAVDSRLVAGAWQHSFVAPKSAVSKEAV